MIRRLELSGALEVTLDDRTFAMTADGSQVRAEVGTFGGLRPSLRFATSGLVLARRLSTALARANVTLTVTRDGSVLAELGAGVRGGRLARLLGFSRIRLVRRKR